MKICYLGGIESIHTQRWVNYFADRGHEVHLIFPASSHQIDLKNVNLHTFQYERIPLKIPLISFFINSLLALRYLRKLLGSIEPDILHVHYISIYSLLAARASTCPLVVTPWGSDVLLAPKKSRVARWIVQYVLKRADLITTDGEHMKLPLVELGADSQKIVLVYFGVDIDKFNPKQRNQRLREELGIFGSPMIISLRTFELKHDIESLITAIPLVLREVPEAKFVIAGDGSQKARLKELVKSLEVSQHVRFVGFISNDELPQYLTSADIYVSTSLSDAGLAASTAEAMACALPVVITDFGDNRKWVEDGVGGFLVPLRSPEALASKVSYLLNNEGDRRNFGKINRQVITERMSWRKEMAKMEKLYEELMERCRK